MRDYRSEIVWRDVSSIVPYVSNTKKHPKDQVAKIASSIAEFGFDQPIVVDGDQIIIKGHGRYLAAQQLKLSQVPVLVRTDLTPAQVKAARIADNRVAQSNWDEDLLRLELNDLKSLDVDLSLTGFDPIELSSFLTDKSVIEEEDEADTDQASVLREQYGVEWGQLWQLGRHRLLIGDATKAEDVTRLLDGRIPWLMVTDPPYGVEYDPTWRDDCGGQFGGGITKLRGKVDNDDRADWREAWDLFPGDVAYIWHASLRSPEVFASLLHADFQVRTLIVWFKQHFTLMRTGYHWSHELLWYAVRNGKTAHWIGDRKQTTVWQIDSLNAAGRKGAKADQEVKLGHGTQKPMECMARPIRNHESEFVYDPFCGSGTTIMACEHLQRIALAMEINPDYGAMILDRFVKKTGIDPVLL